jgi:hypothetical protein
VYHGMHDQVLPTLIVCLATNNDRVERDKMTSSLTHSSPYTRPWGFVGRPSPFDSLVSCHLCHNSRLKRCIPSRALHAPLVTPTSHTTQEESALGCGGSLCADWDYGSSYLWDHEVCPSSNHHPQYSLPPCENVPPHPPNRPVISRSDDISHKVCRPIVKSWDLFKQCLHYSIVHFLVGIWSKKETLAYLQCCGIATHIGTQLVKAKEDLQLANRLPPTFRGNENTYGAITTELLQNLSPPTWLRPVPVKDYILAPMHLLKGTVLDFVTITDAWMSKYKLSSAFRRDVHPILKQLANLSSSWLTVWHFGTAEKPNMTGSWQAKNFIAFARVVKYLFQFLKRIAPNSASGSQAAREAPVIGRLVQALPRMISLILATNHQIVVFEDGHHGYYSALDDAIKLYMTEEYSNVEKLLPRATNRDGKKREPMWSTGGNFLSLPELVGQIKRHGSVRDSWDGRNERFFKLIRPMFGNMRITDSYFQLKHHQINQLQAWAVIEERSLLLETPPPDTSSAEQIPGQKSWLLDRYVTYKAYRDRNTFLASYRDREPLSLVRVWGELFQTTSGETHVIPGDNAPGTSSVLTLACCKAHGTRRPSYQYLLCHLEAAEWWGARNNPQEEIGERSAGDSPPDLLPLPVVTFTPQDLIVKVDKTYVLNNTEQNIILLPVVGQQQDPQRLNAPDFGHPTSSNSVYYCVGDMWQEAQPLFSPPRICLAHHSSFRWTFYRVNPSPYCQEGAVSPTPAAMREE